MTDEASAGEVSLDGVAEVVRCLARVAIDNEKYFSELDSVVGDGDFGFSLARGFEKVLEELDGIDRSSIGAFVKKVGLIVTSRCGGTSGPLWGTAFLRAGITAGDRQTLAASDVVALLRAAFAGIQKRGGAELGDKTLLDALGPFIDRLEQSLSGPGASLSNALGPAAETATSAAEATTGLVARRGRAAYTGERSRGSIDPGAAAVALMARELCRRFPPARA